MGKIFVFISKLSCFGLLLRCLRYVVILIGLSSGLVSVVKIWFRIVCEFDVWWKSRWKREMEGLWMFVIIIGIFNEMCFGNF